MKMEGINQFYKRLDDIGLDKEYIKDKFPDWWSDECAKSPSAFAEFKIILAREFDLDIKTLLDENAVIEFKIK
jgi:hypothetical protein